MPCCKGSAYSSFLSTDESKSIAHTRAEGKQGKLLISCPSSYNSEFKNSKFTENSKIDSKFTAFSKMDLKFVASKIYSELSSFWPLVDELTISTK